MRFVAEIRVRGTPLNSYKFRVFDSAIGGGHSNTGVFLLPLVYAQFAIGSLSVFTNW